MTDGGHWDNLGIVELLRRRCRLIISLDGGGDKSDTFHGISQAISLAHTELGDKIVLEAQDHIEVAVTDSEDKKVVRMTSNHAPGEIVYAPDRRGDGVEDAAIVYCKAVVTPKTPPAIRNYQERNHAFPNHSTALQLFDDERFEAYRSLGYYVAESAYDGKIRAVIRGWGVRDYREDEVEAETLRVMLDDRDAELADALAEIRQLQDLASGDQEPDSIG